MIQPNKEEQEQENTADDVKQRARQFSFDMVGISVGEEIEFCKDKYSNSGLMFKVADNKKIYYNGEPTSLSVVATELLHKTTQVQGPLYFKYKGELLTDMRARLKL